MKKQLTSTISKKVFTILFVAFISCTHSQDLYAFTDSTVNKSVEITYQGLHEKKLAFNVNYKNNLSQSFELIIKNDQDQIIYAKHFDGKPLNKTMLFSEYPENCKLTFSILSGRKELSQSFEINSQVRTVEEFIVKGI
jgi:hypothetical protein